MYTCHRYTKGMPIIWIVIGIVVLIVIVYGVTLMLGIQLNISIISVISIVSGIIAIITTINNTRRTPISDSIKGNEALIDIFDDDNIHNVWNQIYDDTSRDEITALKMLLKMEVARYSMNTDTYSESFKGIMYSWLSTPIIYDTWQKYRYYLNQGSNDLYDTIMSTHM